MVDDAWIEIEPNIALNTLLLRWRTTLGNIDTLVREGILTAYAYREHRYEWHKRRAYGVPIPSFCGVINSKETNRTFAGDRLFQDFAL